MMFFLLYLKLSAASLAGMLIQLFSKSSDMEATSEKANIKYEGFGHFLARDWKAIATNIMVIILTFIIFGKAIYLGDLYMQGKTYNILGIFDLPLSIVWDSFVAIFFGATGYSGQDFILRRVFKSVQNRLIKQVIDEKTTISDAANGTLDTPTPLPSKPTK